MDYTFRKIYYIEPRKGMKAQAFNFLATPRRSAISPFRSSQSFFSPAAPNRWRQEARRKRNVDGPIYFSRSGFVKRLASLATAFPPMSLRLHVPTLPSSIWSDLIRVQWRHATSIYWRANHAAFSYYSKSQFCFYQNTSSQYTICI